MPGAAVVLALLRRRARRREQEIIFRTRINVFGMGDAEVYRTYRFSREAILEITRFLQDDLTSPTLRTHAVQPLVKVLATLHFLATGSFQRTSALSAGMSQPTVSRCVHQVIPAILRHMSHLFIKPSQEVQRMKTMQDFYAIDRFPGTVGAIDCTHVALQPPRDIEHIYCNRKHWHSINVQIIVDAQGLIWHVRAKHPGSCHDSFIYRHSNIPDEFDQNVYGDSWLVGDAAYALGPHMMTPFRNPQTPGEKRYNLAHARTRGVVERTFGLLKSRFRCLDKSGGTLLYSPEFVCKIIGACCILHNFAVRRGLEIELREDLTPQPHNPPLPEANPSAEGRAVRSRLVERYFSRLN